MLSPEPNATLSGAVRLQADARDGVGLMEVEYWYTTSASPYMPNGVAYDDGDWDPWGDFNWWSDWVPIGTVDATTNAWPYTYDGWAPPDGVYTITAVAYDYHAPSAVNPNGVQARTVEFPGSPVTIAVDNVGASDNPPVVTVSSPTDCADIYAAGGNILLRASATDADSTVTDIQFWLVDENGLVQTLGSPDPNTPGEGASASILWDGEVAIPIEMTAPDGPLHIIAEAISDSDPVGYAGVEVNIVGDAFSDVSISYITSDASDYAGAAGGSPVTVTIYGSGFVDSADPDDGVTVYFGGVEAGGLNIISSTELTVTVPHVPDTVPAGLVSVVVEVTSTWGHLTGAVERDDLFAVTDSAPSVSIVSPADAADVGDGVVIVASVLDDRGVTEVVFEADDGTTTIPLGTVTGYPCSVVWDMVADPPPGGFGVAHTITVTARDGVNADATSTIAVTPIASGFDNPPVVTVTSPAIGATVSGYAVPITVVVTEQIGEVLSGVTLQIVDAGSGYVYADADVALDDLSSLTLAPGDPVTGATSDYWTYTATWDSSGVPDGSYYVIEATATDVGGNTGVGGASVTVQNDIPPPPPWPPYPPEPPRTEFEGLLDALLELAFGDIYCGGPGGGTPLPLIVAMMAAAVPLLALRRSKRAGGGRAR
ncbi:MAG: Ig-like domain-containing protein [Planctomycetota bacterium]|jgi:hypothetical protein